MRAYLLPRQYPWHQAAQDGYRPGREYRLVGEHLGYGVNFKFNIKKGGALFAAKRRRCLPHRGKRNAPAAPAVPGKLGCGASPPASTWKPTPIFPIVREGGVEEYVRSAPRSKGTRSCPGGQIRTPASAKAHGITLREIIFDIGGGIKATANSRRLAGGLRRLHPRRAAMPVDYDR